MDLFPKVQKVIAEHFLIDPDSIHENSRLFEDLGADSLDYVDLIMAFEEAFQLDLKDEEFESMKSVKDILLYLKNKSL